MSASFQSLPLARCAVWADNPRRTVGDLAELAESIRAVGVLEPVLARPAGDGWEILAGQRRFLAAGLAGLTEIPALVREVPDDVALELSLAENAARADVSPLEEAEAIERLVRDHGRGVADVAARLGRGVRWVERRRMLLNLTPESRAWCERLRLPLAHMESLSAVCTETQARVIARFGHVREPHGVPAHARFAAEITYELHILASAPFEPDDARLGGRGACAGCAYRSDRQQDLFGGAPEGANCLDATCWDVKVDALWARAEKDAKRRKLAVIEVEAVGSDWPPGRLSIFNDEFVATPPSKDAKPVAITRGRAGHVYELYARPAVSGDSDDGLDPAEEGDAPAGRRREADEENAWEKRQAEREATELERLRRIYALTGDPALHESLLRCAILGDVAEHGPAVFERLARLLGVELPTRPDEAVVAQAFAPEQLLRVLLASLVEGRLGVLDTEDLGDAMPCERDLLARLAVPVAPAVRVWIAEAAWDALAPDERESLEEPVGGAPLPWEGREGWVTTTVPDELLSTVRGLAEAAGATLHEGDEVPAGEALSAGIPLVTLRVKRSVWLQHRLGLQDSAKGVLHKVWQPEGEDRVAVCARGGDAHTKVMAYAQAHGLDVRVGGGA